MPANTRSCKLPVDRRFADHTGSGWLWCRLV